MLQKVFTWLEQSSFGKKVNSVDINSLSEVPSYHDYGNNYLKRMNERRKKKLKNLDWKREILKNVNYFGLKLQVCMNYYVYLRPRSDLKVPPYFGREPIRSMISGMQLANTAYHWSGEDTWRARRRSDDDVVHTCRHREERTEGKKRNCLAFLFFDHQTSTQSTKQLVSNITIAGFQHQFIF